MKKSWSMRGIGHKLKWFGEYFPSQRGGLEASVQSRGQASSEVLWIAAVTERNSFCFKPYFKALMILWCFEIPRLKVIYKGKAVLCNKLIMPRWCSFRVCLKYNSDESVLSIYVSFSSCSTGWRSWGFSPMLKSLLNLHLLLLTSHFCLRSAFIWHAPRIFNFLNYTMIDVG